MLPSSLGLASRHCLAVSPKGRREHACFVGVDDGGLRGGHCGGDQVCLDGVGVDAVVDLGEGPLEVPAQLQAVVLRVLETLKFLDEVELEFRAEP